MTNTVQFPELGLTFTLHPVAFEVFGVQVYWYGILIGIGFLLAVLYGFASSKAMRINRDYLTDAIIGGMIGGIVGARLYYVLFYAGNLYLNDPMQIFNIKNGGLGIYGGIIGGLLVGGLVAKWRKMHVAAVLDVASVGYFIGQGIGRWGNFVNQEAFGTATDLPWGMYSEKTAEIVMGNVHPCFLYESLSCLLGALVLHIFTRYFRRYDGQTFLLYILWYGVERFFIEGLRTDSLLLPGIDLRVSQVLAGVSAAAALVLLIVFRKRTSLSGCGSKAVMELNGIEAISAEKKSVRIDETAESTIFAGISAEEAKEKVEVSLSGHTEEPKGEDTAEGGTAAADNEAETGADAAEEADHAEEKKEEEPDGGTN